MKGKPVPFKIKSIKAGFILISLIAILYTASFVNLFINKEIKTDVISIGEIQESASVGAIFIRNEEVLISDSDGFYIREIEEGRHVKAFSGIVTILADEAPSIMSRISEIDDEILKMKNNINISEVLYSTDLSRLDSEIETKIRRLSIESNDNDISGISALKDQIDMMLKEKAQIFASLNESSPEISALTAERQSLLNQLRSNSRTLMVDKPGTVSYFIDSFESSLNPDSIPSLTSESITSIYEGAAARSIPYGRLYTGKPYAKLITGNSYYIAASADAAAVSEYENGSPIIVKINDIEKTFTATVGYISPVTDGKRIIVIKTDKYLSEIAGMRSANIDVIVNITSGFKVPLTSLVDLNLTDMTAGIFKSQTNIATRVNVKILSKNDEYAVVDNLYPDGDEPIIGVYSTYIVKPENIKEGMMLK